MQQPLTVQDARAVLFEFARRHEDRPAFAAKSSAREKQRTRVASPFVRALFDKQTKFHNDGARRKAALCTRRAGKSIWAAVALIDAGEANPGSASIYLATTRKQARRIIWKELKRFNAHFRLGMKLNSVEMVAVLRNGSEIIVGGAANESDIDRLRGQAFVIAIIDEAGSFGEHIRPLVDEVLEPTTMDYDGTIVLIGTPAGSCAGLFYEVTTGAPGPEGRPTIGWSVHGWSVLDNPFIPHAKEWLARLRKDKGILESDAKYRREWNREWVRSNESIVFKEFLKAKNVVAALPKTPPGSTWFYGLGVDLGFDDPSVIVEVAWNDRLPDLYVTWVWRKDKVTPSHIAAEIKRRMKLRDGLMFVVVDQGGGSGKMVTEEFIQRHGINAEGADKQKKQTFIEFLNGDLRTGRMKIVLDPAAARFEADGKTLTTAGCIARLIEQIERLQWDPDRPGKEDEMYENDATDAWLYAWRRASHYLFDTDADEPEHLRPEKGSIEDGERQAKKQEKKILEAHKRRMRDEADPSDGAGWDPWNDDT